ncbi:hypothetical protein ABZ890_39570 [Streptomyces sp. NPDC046984]|uniref:hypothetical protein n=1 Tax=Streptomyces sp. NPDC046984 TaxID=3155138 RepID=UPI0033E32C16
MTDRPYTDEDLRAAAALMHYALTTQPNPADADAVLNGHPAWANVEVGSDEEDELRESVVELVSGAADVSGWAVNIGADGLEPSPDVLNLDGDDTTVVRVHMAFHPDVSERDRQYFGLALAHVMANAL